MNNRISVTHHLGVPETQNTKPSFFQVGCSFRVVLGLVMVLAAIQFNNYFMARCAKIYNEGANGVLAAKTDVF